MPSNIEIKAHYDEERLRRIQPRLGAVVERLTQLDTFFKCTTGRLKLRQEVANGIPRSALIGYNRLDDSGPSRSTFTKTDIPNPVELSRILESTLGLIGAVKKVRELYHVTHPEAKLVSRVHIDTVEGLGRFLELEVLLTSDDDEEAGIKFAKQLTQDFEIKDSDLISTAYMDMLKAKESQN